MHYFTQLMNEISALIMAFLVAIGAVTVPVDKELPVEDMASIMNTAECSAVVFSTVSEQKITALRESVPTLKNFVEWGEAAADFALPIAKVFEAGKKKYEDGDR